MKLSIVTTLYYSNSYIVEFYRRAGQEARKFGGDYEIIFVNDGSPDQSVSTAIELSKSDPHVVVVDLARNFGHHAAMLAGIGEARGEYVFILDVDLEELPEWLSLFREEMELTGADVIYGRQIKRKGRIFERFSGFTFYRLFNLLSWTPIPENLTMARLMKRIYVDALLRFNEKTVFLGGIFELVGYDQRALAVHKGAKPSTTYSLKRRVSLLVNAITSFSDKPLLIVFYLGLTISVLALAASLYLILGRVFFQVYMSGWPSLIVSVWLLSGLIIASIGVVGIYISKIFQEIKNRPRHIVKTIHRFQ